MLLNLLERTKTETATTETCSGAATAHVSVPLFRVRLASVSWELREWGAVHGHVLWAYTDMIQTRSRHMESAQTAHCSGCSATSTTLRIYGCGHQRCVLGSVKSAVLRQLLGSRCWLRRKSTRRNTCSGT